MELLRREFNLLAPENAMKWDHVHPQPETYDFREADTLVAFAQANGMAVYGHALVWHQQLPEWILKGRYYRQEWIQILCKHIKTVVHHFRGKIYAWDVVNEALSNDGPLYPESIWMRKIGRDHIAMAFQWAHEADPDALLVYNEHSAEGMNVKSQAVYDLVKGLLENGIPIDAVGMQMHIGLVNPPAIQDIDSNMQRLADLGLQVHITEMDVRTGPIRSAAKFTLQADIYRRVLAVCLAHSNCRVFATWGVSDRHSWIPGLTGRPDAPLLFDQAGAPKPAYTALFDLLSQPLLLP
jgi:endo-1,4-beta-xylanase